MGTDQDISFNNDGFELSDDIMGASSRSRSDSDDPATLADPLLVEAFSLHREGVPELLHNNAAAGAPMNNKFATEKVPSRESAPPIRHVSELRKLASRGDLEGRLYVAASRFATCGDFDRVLHQSGGPRFAFVLGDADRCSGCRGICSVSHKPLLKGLVDTPAMVSEYREAMIAADLIPPGTTATTLADLESALHGTPTKGPRVYDGGGPAAQPAPVISEATIQAELAKVASQRAQERQECERAAAERRLQPVQQAIAQMLLRRVPVGAIKRDLPRRFSGAQIGEAGRLLAARVDPAWLVVGSVAVPHIYRSCNACRDVLRAHGLQPSHVAPKPECAACNKRGSATNSCSLFAAPFLPPRDHTALADVAGPIVALHKSGILSHEQACESARAARDNPIRGLRVAAGHVLGTPQGRPTPGSAAAAGPTATNPIAWASEAVAQGMPVDQVRAGVVKRGLADGAGEVVEAVLRAAPLVHAAALGNCSKSRRCELHGAVVVPHRRCVACSQVVAGHCLALNRKLGDAASVAVGDDWHAAMASDSNSEFVIAPERVRDARPLDIELGSNGAGIDAFFA